MSDYGRLMEEVIAGERRYLAALDGVLAALTVEAPPPEPCPPDPMNAPEPAV